ncbi:NACHT domain-containing protein [Methylobacterium sp. E-041]|uniref:NACHT domain-containing protein n=1 Tax=Methylobacterium sp. E-041 TaxID=2836573 RepID=UPI001FB9EC69|nr:NACHT domain-containing protein [Methylobacterium sp. E-041]MCJ2103817.1 NACHT domain-containing protein [Methylobacterium sp. E-041]
MSQAGTDFERVVVDFCRRHWGAEHVHPNRMIDGREIDVIIETSEELIIIECTIVKTKKKAEGDISKIRTTRRSLVGDLQQKKIKGFFVLPEDPTPEIHQIAEENGLWIEACSLPTFINRFNCSSSYLIERRKRSFGSVRNPIDDTINIERNQYVQVSFRTFENNSEVTLESITKDIAIKKRTRLVVTGDFGVGKSMTFRELFYRLAEEYEAGKTYRFPIYINLSEAAFDESDDFIDLLERHAKWIGLRSERDKLVRAWTSDCCILMLDGFDELIRAGFTRLTTSSRDIRYASAHIIRAAVKESPINTPIFVSGRQSYFSSFDEMRECLHARDFSHVSLQDLLEKEVKALYHKINPQGKKPIIMEWMPQRALLLSYIYFELGDKLADDEKLLNPLSPGYGWNILLDRLCARETNVAKGAEPRQIRRLLERIALFARTNISDPGRVTSLHVADAYRDVMLMEPDISVQQVLMRFPGLTAGHANEERGFIDRAIFEAAQAGTICDAIVALSSKSVEYIRTDDIARLIRPLARTRNGITNLTAQIVNSSLQTNGHLSLVFLALNEIMSHHSELTGNLAADLLVCASIDPELFTNKNSREIVVSSALISEIEISPELLDLCKIKFEDCIFDELEISVDIPYLSKLKFERCRVQRLNCSQDVSRELASIGLRADHIENTMVIDATNSDILSLHIDDGFKIAKIVLRKLFYKAGSGRKKSAFYRGMGDLDMALIDKFLNVLHRYNIVYVIGNRKSDTSVWHPNRIFTKRVSFIVDSIAPPDDIILKSVQ